MQKPAMQKSIVITGCSSGIGLDAARTLKARGWRVFATARSPQDMTRLSQADSLEVLHLELADAASIAACASAVLDLTGGRIDAIYNNAAYGQPGAVEDLTPAVLREQIEINLIGTHDLTRRLIPAMRRNGFGRIVQCSSVLGFVAVGYRGAYCASKFALEALSIAMRQELAGSGTPRLDHRAGTDPLELRRNGRPCFAREHRYRGFAAPGKIPRPPCFDGGGRKADVQARACGGHRETRSRARKPAPAPALSRHRADALRGDCGAYSARGGDGLSRAKILTGQRSLDFVILGGHTATRRGEKMGSRDRWRRLI